MFNLYVDGGGQKEKTYFSFYSPDLFKNVNMGKYRKPIHVEMNRFFMVNLSPELLPENCSIIDSSGNETNNLAEYAALYYGLQRSMFFMMTYHKNLFPLTVYQDSQLIVNQVNGIYSCNSPHLVPWNIAVKEVLWSKVKITWVKRNIIENILGH